MKGTFKNIIGGILFLLAGVLALPVMIIIALAGLLVNFVTNIQCMYLNRKKYNEKKVKKRLYNRLRQILSTEKEISICKEFWIPIEEYNYYITLKYIFTGNKRSFIYRKGCDKYLYNFYDSNAYKDGFIEKWVEEIKKMFDSEDSVRVEEVIIKDSDDAKNRNILKISCY